MWHVIYFMLLDHTLLSLCSPKSQKRFMSNSWIPSVWVHYFIWPTHGVGVSISLPWMIANGKQTCWENGARPKIKGQQAISSFFMAISSRPTVYYARLRQPVVVTLLSLSVSLTQPSGSQWGWCSVQSNQYVAWQVVPVSQCHEHHWYSLICN